MKRSRHNRVMRFAGLYTVAAGLMLALMLPTGCKENRGESEPSPLGDAAPVQVVLSTNIIHIGDVFTARVSVAHAAGAEVENPIQGMAKDLVVRDSRRETVSLDPTRERTDITYELTSFRVGVHRLSTNAVVCALADGSVQQYPFPKVSIEVDSLLEGENVPMQDIAAPVSWPGRFPRWIQVLALIALLTVIAALIAKRFIHSRQQQPPPPPPPPPDEVALHALRLLREKGLIEEDQVEPFYVELSSIARHYLEDRFDLRAPERTTEEFIREATRSRLLSAEHQRLVREFLEQCDLVKFARHHPAREDMEHAFSAAEQLVRETRPTHDEEATP